MSDCIEYPVGSGDWWVNDGNYDIPCETNNEDCCSTSCCITITVPTVTIGTPDYETVVTGITPTYATATFVSSCTSEIATASFVNSIGVTLGTIGVLTHATYTAGAATVVVSCSNTKITAEFVNAVTSSTSEASFVTAVTPTAMSLDVVTSVSPCTSAYINIPTYTLASADVDILTYPQPYYSSSSSTPRTPPFCTPGGYDNQPPSPTWTNGARSKLFLEVTYRDGISREIEKESKKVAPSGWHLPNGPDRDLVIRIRDYASGGVIRELDNSIDFWAWCTAKDAENVFNDPYPPFGNKIMGDPRYGTGAIQLVKSNVTIERHHQIERIEFVDTPQQPGHLTEFYKS